MKLNFGRNEVKLRVRKWDENMDMKQTRRLKIVKSISPKLSPLLPLKGNWLAQAGFRTGMYVDVIVREQCLVILPSKRDDHAQYEKE